MGAVRVGVELHSAIDFSPIRALHNQNTFREIVRSGQGSNLRRIFHET